LSLTFPTGYYVQDDTKTIQISVSNDATPPSPLSLLSIQVVKSWKVFFTRFCGYSEEKSEDLVKGVKKWNLNVEDIYILDMFMLEKPGIGETIQERLSILRGEFFSHFCKNVIDLLP